MLARYICVFMHINMHAPHKGKISIPLSEEGLLLSAKECNIPIHSNF